MDEEFRSWRMRALLKSELVAGNAVFSIHQNRDSTIVILEKIFMAPLTPDDGVVEYTEQTFAPKCYKNVYHDTQTNEYLACRIPTTFLEKVAAAAGRIIKKK